MSLRGWHRLPGTNTPRIRALKVAATIACRDLHILA